MGNRAVVKLNPEDKIGIYLHWNGGIGSVRAFLEYCKLRGFQTDDYGIARFTQVVANFFGGSTSIGVIPVSAETEDEYNEEATGLDNGIYVCKNWEIVARYPQEWRPLDEPSEYDLDEMLRDIDREQPEADRLGEYLTGTPCSALELKPGDVVMYMDWNGVRKVTIQKIVDGLPYTGEYDEDNPNAYLNPSDTSVRRLS